MTDKLLTLVGFDEDDLCHRKCAGCSKLVIVEIMKLRGWCRGATDNNTFRIVCAECHVKEKGTTAV